MGKINENLKEHEIKKNSLYVVGTPIGNMSDISERAVRALKNVDFIAAEDTRKSGLLLSRLGIDNKGRLTSYHEHNAVTKADVIIRRLKAGESCAIITDAGMPCVSDPGEILVRMCAENGIDVYTVPGPCAMTAALSVSGIDTGNTGRFCFEGFLPVDRKSRSERLNLLKNNRSALIFYEAPHRLRTTLSDLAEFLGDRKIAVCRELTKMYEQVERGRISDIIGVYGQKSPKGEYVLVVEGADSENEKIPMMSISEAGVAALELHKSGIGLSQAAKTVAEQSGLRKSEVYKSALESQKRKIT